MCRVSVVFIFHLQACSFCLFHVSQLQMDVENKHLTGVHTPCQRPYFPCSENLHESSKPRSKCFFVFIHLYFLQSSFYPSTHTHTHREETRSSQGRISPVLPSVLSAAPRSLSVCCCCVISHRPSQTPVLCTPCCSPSVCHAVNTHPPLPRHTHSVIEMKSVPLSSSGECLCTGITPTSVTSSCVCCLFFFSFFKL